MPSARSASVILATAKFIASTANIDVATDGAGDTLGPSDTLGNVVLNGGMTHEQRMERYMLLAIELLANIRDAQQNP